MSNNVWVKKEIEDGLTKDNILFNQQNVAAEKYKHCLKMEYVYIGTELLKTENAPIIKEESVFVKTKGNYKARKGLFDLQNVVDDENRHCREKEHVYVDKELLVEPEYQPLIKEESITTEWNDQHLVKTECENLIKEVCIKIDRNNQLMVKTECDPIIKEECIKIDQNNQLMVGTEFGPLIKEESIRIDRNNQQVVKTEFEPLHNEEGIKTKGNNQLNSHSKNNRSHLQNVFHHIGSNHSDMDTTIKEEKIFVFQDMFEMKVERNTSQNIPQIDICNLSSEERQTLSFEEKFKPYITGSVSKYDFVRKSITPCRENHSSPQVLQTVKSAKNMNGTQNLKMPHAAAVSSPTNRDGNNHDQKHIEMTQFQCKFCSRSFTTKPGRTRHERIHYNTGRGPFPCKFCNRCFVTKAGRYNHERHHKVNRPFPCALCDQSFNSKGGRANHERIHSIVVRCSYCGQAFTTTQDLANHEEIHLAGRRVFHCKSWDQSFTTKQGLANHESFSHSVERQRQIHTKMRVYPCKFCGQLFTTIQSWTEHELTHSVE